VHPNPNFQQTYAVTIAKSLADEETWQDAFDDEKEARDTKDELSLAFDQLYQPSLTETHEGILESAKL
jgi:hypothetical protein